MALFSDPPRTAVFTTRYVLDGAPITYVTHDEGDGAWQFFSNDQFDNVEEVARVIALEEVVALDASILEIADMPVGHYAKRESPSDPWIVRPSN